MRKVNSITRLLTVIVAARFVQVARKVIKASEKRVRILEDQYKGLDPQGEIERIKDLLIGMLNEINELGTEGEKDAPR
jgi:hypothetical protein